MADTDQTSAKPANGPQAAAPAPTGKDVTQAAEAAAVAAQDPREAKIAHMIRAACSDSPISRDVGAWNALITLLPTLAAAIAKEI